MKIKFGIVLKLFFFYVVTSLIFYGTIVILFIHIRQLVHTSEDIANRNYRISTASKKMIDNLIWMAENQKKYDLLKKEDYKEYFATAQKNYEANLVEFCGPEGERRARPPGRISTRNTRASSPLSPGKPRFRLPWLKEELINEWVDKISRARSANEQQIESRMKSLNERAAPRCSGASSAGDFSDHRTVGGARNFLFDDRPLRELRRGIKSLSRSGLTDPIGSTPMMSSANWPAPSTTWPPGSSKRSACGRISFRC